MTNLSRSTSRLHKHICFGADCRRRTQRSIPKFVVVNLAYLRDRIHRVMDAIAELEVAYVRQCRRRRRRRRRRRCCHCCRVYLSFLCHDSFVTRDADDVVAAPMM